MSDAEMNAVVVGVHAALKELDSPGFRKFRSAQGPDGKIFVCGWVSDRGEYAEERPMIGTLFAGQFVLDRVGKHQTERELILSECSELGIAIN
jgi:hypothetical protein